MTTSIRTEGPPTTMTTEGKFVTALEYESGDRDDQSFTALNLILAAWDEGSEMGVTPQMMAYAALFTALTDLVSIYGEDAVVALARGLEGRLEKGEFSLGRRVQ